MHRLLVLALASCAVDTSTITSDVVDPDAATTCGLPEQCAPWSATTNGSILILDRNWYADWQCTIACGQPAQCPARIPNGCLTACAPLAGDAYSWCAASCYDQVRTTCYFSLGDP